MRKITHLTEEQADLGRATYKKWIEIATASGVVDKKEVEAGLRIAYAKVELPPPEFRWFSSPISGIVAAVFEIAAGRPTFTDKIFLNQIKVVANDIAEKVTQEVSTVLLRELDNAIEGAAAEIAEATAVEIRIRASVVGNDRPKTGRVLEKLVACAVSKPWEGLALIDFMNLLGARDKQRIVGLCAAARTGWYWPFESLAIMTELPAQIHFDEKGKPHREDGPAIEYADGFEIYCHHGVRIPPEAVPGSGAGELAWEDIEKTADRPVKDALAAIKAERWADSKRDEEGATAAERRGAASAIRQLGGISALRGLVEDE